MPGCLSRASLLDGDSSTSIETNSGCSLSYKRNKHELNSPNMVFRFCPALSSSFQMWIVVSHHLTSPFLTLFKMVSFLAVTLSYQYSLQTKEPTVEFWESARAICWLKGCLWLMDHREVLQWANEGGRLTDNGSSVELVVSNWLTCASKFQPFNAHVAGLFLVMWISAWLPLYVSSSC